MTFPLPFTDLYKDFQPDQRADTHNLPWHSPEIETYVSHQIIGNIRKQTAFTDEFEGVKKQLKINAREYAIKSMRDVAEKLRGRSITEAGDHEKEMKGFFRRYGEMLQNSQLDIHELDEECHEMINESLDYALTYLFDWDYRINVPKLKKEVHRLMDLKCLCDLVSRARILTKYYAPNGVVLEELIYRRYCSNIVRTDVEVWQEMGFSRSVYYEKKKTALQYMGFFFFEIVIPQAVDNQKRVSEIGWI